MLMSSSLIVSNPSRRSGLVKLLSRLEPPLHQVHQRPLCLHFLDAAQQELSEGSACLICPHTGSTICLRNRYRLRSPVRLNRLADQMSRGGEENESRSSRNGEVVQGVQLFLRAIIRRMPACLLCGEWLERHSINHASQHYANAELQSVTSLNLQSAPKRFRSGGNSISCGCG